MDLPLSAAPATELAVHEETNPLAALVVAFLLVLCAIAVAAVRVIWADERLVIQRLGRTVRVRGPGAVFIVPGIERAFRVPLRARPVGPLCVRTRTLDAIDVHAAVSALVQIVDPALAVAEGGVNSSAAALERAVLAEIARTDLADLATDPGALADAVGQHASLVAAPLGIRLSCVEISEIDVPLDAHLVTWAERHAGPRPGTR
ncbi:MAG: SPFH domain-containing protein [Sporichthyaceae bacterium]